MANRNRLSQTLAPRTSLKTKYTRTALGVGLIVISAFGFVYMHQEEMVSSSQQNEATRTVPLETPPNFPVQQTALKSVEFAPSTTISEEESDESVVYTNDSWVDWKQIQTQTHNETVDISWSTAREINTSYFEIQRSVNAVDFETIARVEGPDSTETRRLTYRDRKYQFIDPGFAATGMPRVYYRIKHIGKDNVPRLSEATVQSFRLKKGLYAKPVFHRKGKLRIHYAADDAGTARLKVVGPEGTLIHEQDIHTHLQVQELHIDASDWVKGSYRVLLAQNEFHLDLPVEKQ